MVGEVNQLNKNKKRKRKTRDTPTGFGRTLYDVCGAIGGYLIHCQRVGSQCRTCEIFIYLLNASAGSLASVSSICLDGKWNGKRICFSNGRLNALMLIQFD